MDQMRKRFAEERVVDPFGPLRGASIGSVHGSFDDVFDARGLRAGAFDPFDKKGSYAKLGNPFGRGDKEMDEAGRQKEWERQIQRDKQRKEDEKKIAEEFKRAKEKKFCDEKKVVYGHNSGTVHSLVNPYARMTKERQKYETCVKGTEAWNVAPDSEEDVKKAAAKKLFKPKRAAKKGQDSDDDEWGARSDAASSVDSDGFPKQKPLFKEKKEKKRMLSPARGAPPNVAAALWSLGLPCKVDPNLPPTAVYQDYFHFSTCKHAQNTLLF